MVNEQLLTYIRNQLQRGVTSEEIKSALLARGWVLADVEEGFRAAKSDLAATKPEEAAPREEEKIQRDAPPQAGLVELIPIRQPAAKDLITEVTPPLSQVSPLPSQARPQPNLTQSPSGPTRATPILTSRPAPLKRKMVLGGVLLVVFLLALFLGWSIFRLRQGGNGATSSPAPAPPLYQPLTPAPPPSEAPPAGLRLRGSDSRSGQASPGAELGPRVTPSVTSTPPPAPPEADADNDSLPDSLEACYGSNPSSPDTDGDGWQDGEEAANGYNPLGPGKMPESLKAKCQ